MLLTAWLCPRGPALPESCERGLCFPQPLSRLWSEAEFQSQPRVDLCLESASLRQWSSHGSFSQNSTECGWTQITGTLLGVSCHTGLCWVKGYAFPSCLHMQLSEFCDLLKIIGWALSSCWRDKVTPLGGDYVMKASCSWLPYKRVWRKFLCSLIFQDIEGVIHEEQGLSGWTLNLLGPWL